jgi:hypothetical protein
LRASRSRWFVEEQQIRLAEQQLREREPHLPSAGERFRAPIEIRRCEAEALKNRGRLQLDAVPAADAEAILKIAIALEHRIVFSFRNRGITEPLLEIVHLGLDGEELGERARHLFEHGAARMREAVLRKIPDGEGRRFQDGAGVGLVETGHHAQQRRLARAVRSAQSDALAVGDLPRHMVEKHTVAEGLGEFLELDHAEA